MEVPCYGALEHEALKPREKKNKEGRLYDREYNPAQAGGIQEEMCRTSRREELHSPKREGKQATPKL